MDDAPTPAGDRPAHPLWRQLAGDTLAPDQTLRLHRHLDLLLEHNRRLNLTAVRDRDLAEVRHTADALQLLPFLPEAGEVLDLGSGGGVPGVPLAIVRPDLRFTLLDSVAKKADALRRMVEELALANVEVVAARAEAEPALRDRYAVVVARAVAPLAKLWAWSRPLLVPGGVLLALKGRTGPAEAAGFRNANVRPAAVGDGTIIEVRR